MEFVIPMCNENVEISKLIVFRSITSYDKTGSWKRSLTIEAFSGRVDYGEVVAGTSSNHQVEWPPLVNLVGAERR